MILIILMILAWWFLYKKTYYVRIESVGSDIPTMEQLLKVELETTLRQAIFITKNTPYIAEGGGYFNARAIAKKIEEKGGVAKVKFFWVWSKPQVGPVQENK